MEVNKGMKKEDLGERAERLKKSKREMGGVQIGYYRGRKKLTEGRKQNNGRTARSAVDRCAVVRINVDDPRGSRVKGCYAIRIAPPNGKDNGSVAHITASHILRAYEFEAPVIDENWEDWVLQRLFASKLGRPILEEMTQVRRRAKAEAVKLPFPGLEPRPEKKPTPEPETKHTPHIRVPGEARYKPTIPPINVLANINQPGTIAVTVKGRKYEGTPEAIRKLFEI